MKIYLVRHTSVDVAKGIAYGQTDVPLKTSFEDEAAQVKANLRGVTFDQVYCSPLSRCVRLAAYCGFPEAYRDNRLKELNFGEWEMQSWDMIAADPRSVAWFDDWVHVATPGGESLMDQYKRVSLFFDELRQTSCQCACIFTHGGVLSCARIYAGLYTMDQAFDDLPPYGSIITLTLEP